jgi:hypothetical protein
MNIGEIVKDSLRYPFSDWKKFLIFAVIVLMGMLLPHFASIFGYLALIILIIGFLIQILEYGYWFRIIKSSLNGSIELPEFNTWSNMFKDGIGMFIILFIYLIPAYLIIFLTEALPSLSSGIIVAIVYIIIILPIIAVEAVQMADDNIESKMFQFREIINKIGILGANRFIKWYLTTGVIFLIILALGIGAVMVVEKLTFSLIGTIMFWLLVFPYLSMYLTRSIALIFQRKNKTR